MGDGMRAADALDGAESFVRRYVDLGDDESAAVVLWTAHTHLIQAADTTPYLAVTSVTKRCGKTRLLEALELVVARPLRVSSISEAALFRMLGDSPVTLLFDEMDAVFCRRGAAQQLRGLLNAGYRRGSQAVRNEKVGERWVPRSYDPFGAKALAAIGGLPDTIADRSISVRMTARTPGRSVDRLRHRQARQESAPVKAALASLATGQTLKLLAAARPRVPDEIDDRSADGWEPLLCIADLAGPRWAARGRAAAVALTRVRGVDVVGSAAASGGRREDPQVPGDVPNRGCGRCGWPVGYASRADGKAGS